MNDEMTKLFSIFLAVAVLCGFEARGDEASDYKKFVEETKTWVYSLDLPAFEVREIPEKYNDQSAVYVVIYNSLAVIRNNEPGRLPGTLRFANDKRIESGMLQRKLIYINDRAALDEFSEYDFTSATTMKYNMSQRKYRQVLGVKVIKPDGTERVVDTDDYVEVKADKKGKTKRSKLAVPGLEIGDMIDVFNYVSEDIHNAHLDPMMFILREDYPVMSYSVHWLLDGSLASSYRLLNGAPDFVGFLDGAKNYHVDMELVDLPARPRLYYDDILQSPLIKLFVFNPEAEDYMPKSSSGVGLRGDPFTYLIKNEWWNLRQRVTYDTAGKDFLRSALKNGAKAVDRLTKAFKAQEITLTEAADCLYNLMFFAQLMSDEGINPLAFDVRLQSLLKPLAGDSLKAVMTTPAGVESIADIASIFGVTTGSGLPDGKRYYFQPVSFMAPSELHSRYSGRVAQQCTVDKLDKVEQRVDTLYFNLPENRARGNRKYCSLTVGLDGSDVEVHRVTTCTGVAKQGHLSLLSMEDVTRAYLEYFDRYGLEIGIKESGKKASDRLALYADGILNQKDDFEAEVKDFHGSVDVDSVKGEIMAVGIDPKSPKYVYNLDYSVRDLVRRAGRNLLVSVGRLIEQEGELLDSDRQRTDYTVTKGAREYITRIELLLPPGAKVSDNSLAALNRTVSNSAGLFGVSAKADDGKVVVDIIKRYDRRFLPASSWPDMVEIIDAVVAWQASTLLIEC